MSITLGMASTGNSDCGKMIEHSVTVHPLIVPSLPSPTTREKDLEISERELGALAGSIWEEQDW